MFYTGQKVVCVTDAWVTGNRGDDFEVPKGNEVYTVLSWRMGQKPEDQGHQFLVLKELKNPPSPRGIPIAFAAYCFRPLVQQKTDISIFKQAPDPGIVAFTKRIFGFDK